MKKYIQIFKHLFLVLITCVSVNCSDDEVAINNVILDNDGDTI